MLKIRYGVDSNGDLVKREPLVINDFVREGKLYSLYHDANLPKTVPVDFAYPTNPNAYCDWILFPAKLPLPADHPDVQKKLSGNLDPEADALLADVVQDANGGWWYLGVGLCVCERNYCDGEYVSVGRKNSGLYGRIPVLHYLECGEMVFISPSNRDYRDDAAYLAIAEEVDWEHRNPKGILATTLAFYHRCENLPEYTCVSNEMTLWLYYRYGVSVNQTDFRRFEHQLEEWQRDRGFTNFTITPIPQEGAFELTVRYPKYQDVERVSKLYYRRSDRGENVLLLPSGQTVRTPEDIWDSLEELVTELGRYSPHPYWFSSAKACDDYLAKAKEIYKAPVPLRPLQRRNNTIQLPPREGQERS